MHELTCMGLTKSVMTVKGCFDKEVLTDPESAPALALALLATCHSMLTQIQMALM